jgi:RNA polymerase sigma-70 factor (ECF subfamily)
VGLFIVNPFLRWRGGDGTRASANDDAVPRESDAAPDSSEAELIARARGGDRRAFDALVRTYHDSLFGFLARRLDGAAEAASDIVQETLIAAWSALPRFDGRSRFKTWLYGIALHKCADHARREKRRGEVTQEIGGEVAQAAREEASIGQSVEDLYVAAQLRETVQSLLVRLPAPQREVIEMYYYADLTLPEIAHALGRNLNTVKYQFYRAHAVVARALEVTQPADFSPAAEATQSLPRDARGPFSSGASGMSFFP